MNFVQVKKEEENTSLIVFFNGWGFDEDAVKHLSAQGFDVLLLFDYRDFNIDFEQFHFEKYEKKLNITDDLDVGIVQFVSKDKKLDAVIIKSERMVGLIEKKEADANPPDADYEVNGVKVIVR